jgi:KAP family P-loop domain
LGLLFLWSATSDSAEPSGLGDLEFVGGLIGLIASVFAGATALFGIFFARPEEAAARFVGSRADPLLRLERHVRTMIQRVRQPVAVFVDDLDRCSATFVVEFLEGVQTLFRGAPVTFVVAADREWLYQSFEKIYTDFRLVVPNPARPLGHLFLEKTFQMSVAVPPISEERRHDYWRWLLRFDVDAGREAQEEVRKAEQEVTQSVTERDVLAKVAATGGESELHVTRHLLEKFGPLLEANPRSMKRLVMAYGMNRATDLLMGRLTPADTLALWTVFVMRWPRLAEWLEIHPDSVELFDGADPPGPPVGPPPDLAPLFKDPQIRRVFAGGGIVEGIGVEALRSLSHRGPNG